MATTKVTSGGITDATIATADIADGAVTNAKIASGISASKITGLATDSITEGNSTAEVLDTGTNGIFRFLPEGNEVFRITHEGKVGINTNNPSRSLHVASSFIRVDDGYGLDTSGATEKVTLDNGFVSLTTNSTERLRINSSGQVGIGTASPVQQAGRGVHIHGTDQTRVKLTNTNSGSTANDGFDIIQESDSDINIVNHENAVIKFSTNSSEGARIDQSGRLLIGTTVEGHSTADDLTVASSGHTGISIRSGTSNNGNIYFSDATTGNAELAGYIQYSHANNHMLFGTSESNAMLIDSSGNVGIGVASHDPLTKLHVQGANNTALLDVLTITNQTGSSGTEVGMVFECGADEVARISAKNEGSDIGPLIFSTASSQTANPTEKMRLDHLGGLRINSTGTVIADELLSIQEDGTAHELCGFRINSQSHTKDMITMAHVANSGDRMFMRFKRTGSLSNVGSINTNPSITAFNTSSDYRLKENEVLISDGITRLKQLKPYRFNFKIEPTRTVDGFFAHEVSPVVAEAVTGVKDAVDEKGNIDPQGLDYAKFTPLLTAALQEEISKREALEARVAALEAA